MSKPHITTTVHNVDSSNLDSVKKIIDVEASSYQIHTVGNENISTCPMCLDTETTTVEEDGKKYALIYMLQLQVGTITLLTRTKDIMLNLLYHINVLGESYNTKFVIGIANIKYEWSFLCKSIMAMDDDAKASIYFGRMDPLSVDIGGIRLVDITRMANSSLAKIGKDFCTTQKLKGDLDYDKIRNSMTPLTQDELNYCINDVVVGAEYLMHMHQKYTSNDKAIPTTSTGMVRAAMKEVAYAKDNSGKYIYADVFEDIKKGFPEKSGNYSKVMDYLFRGGYTHGNDYYVGMVLEDVEHIDYTSDYPACMLQFKYPTKFSKRKFAYEGKDYTVSKWSDETHLRELLKYEDDIAYYATFEFIGIERTTPHSIESSNKALYLSDDVILDNGRIASASKLKVMLTEQDFKVYTKFYRWDSVKVTDLYVGIKQPLPMYVLESIIQNYVAKCALKNERERLKDAGLPYEHISYVTEKALLNSVYGCTVERIHIEDRREVYDYVKDDVITIDSPVPFRMLLPNNMVNIKYIDGYIPDTVASKYGYANNKTLHAMIRKICKDIYDGKKPDRDDTVYMNIYNTIVYKLQARAYHEEVNGTKIDEKGHRIGKPKMLSCWWGIWCTAYARARLLEMTYDVEVFANDNGYEPITVYSDTDSMFLNAHQDEKCWEAVKGMIDAYNSKITTYNTTVLSKYDNSGLLDTIGLFDWEAPADLFKHLGAKRYLQYFRKRDYIESTVAGLNKKDFANKVNGISGDVMDKFAYFSDGMVFDEIETGKMRPVYYTKPYSATVTDEYGNTEVMSEECGQVLESIGFKMTLATSYAKKVIEVENRIG